MLRKWDAIHVPDARRGEPLTRGSAFDDSTSGLIDFGHLSSGCIFLKCRHGRRVQSG
jgi:hypothetical protein